MGFLDKTHLGFVWSSSLILSLFRKSTAIKINQKPPPHQNSICSSESIDPK